MFWIKGEKNSQVSLPIFHSQRQRIQKQKEKIPVKLYLRIFLWGVFRWRVIFVILLMDEIKPFCIFARGIYTRHPAASGHEVNGHGGHRAPMGAASSGQAPSLLFLPLPCDGPMFPGGRFWPGACPGRPGDRLERGLIQGPPAPDCEAGTHRLPWGSHEAPWGKRAAAPRACGDPPGPGLGQPCPCGLPLACRAVPSHQALPTARGHRGTLPPPWAGLIRLSPFSSSPQGSVAAWPPWGWNGGCACQGHGEGRDLPVRVSAVKKTWILTSGTSRRCWARQQPPGELGLWGGAERSRGNCI